MSRITFQEETDRELHTRMETAYQSGNLRLVSHLAVLIGIAQGEGLAEVLAVWHVCEATVFAQWGSLSYTWASKGCQPLVKTSGLCKGYKIFGLIEFFTGRFYWLDCAERNPKKSCI